MDAESTGSDPAAHRPVMPEAVLSCALGMDAQGEDARGEAAQELEGWIVDATVGAGGHAARLLEAAPGVRLLGLDQDPEALELARVTLSSFGQRALLRRARMSGLKEALAEEGVASPLCVLFDLGVSSMQLDRPARGFSFTQDGPLDMRMDPSRERTAADIVNAWDEADLADLFYYEGGERGARRVARTIVEGRRGAPFLRTLALAERVALALGRRAGAGRIHPATRTFQALRRAVNQEGEELTAGLRASEEVLAAGGRLVVISFHSGEDGVVKRFLAEGSRRGAWRLLTKRPLSPAEAEKSANRRARSARLRAAERLRVGGEAAA